MSCGFIGGQRLRTDSLMDERLVFRAEFTLWSHIGSHLAHKIYPALKYSIMHYRQRLIIHSVVNLEVLIRHSTLTRCNNVGIFVNRSSNMARCWIYVYTKPVWVWYNNNQAQGDTSSWNIDAARLLLQWDTRTTPMSRTRVAPGSVSNTLTLCLTVYEPTNMPSISYYKAYSTLDLSI